MRRGRVARADMELIGEYDEIEIPRSSLCCAPSALCLPLRALRRGRQSSGAGRRHADPFGPRIHALAIYLKGFQALSYERLRFLFRDAFA